MARKRVFEDTIKLKVLRWEDYPDYLGGQPFHLDWVNAITYPYERQAEGDFTHTEETVTKMEQREVRRYETWQPLARKWRQPLGAGAIHAWFSLEPPKERSPAHNLISAQ